MLLFLPPRRWSSVCPPSPCFSLWGSSKPRALARSAGTVWGSSCQLQATICTSGAATVPPKPTSVRIMCWKFLTSVLKGFSCWCTYKNLRFSLFQLLLHSANSGGMETTVLTGWYYFLLTMWNSRSPCGAESVPERRSSHCWTSWIPLDKVNHWQSTPAVTPDGWVQWALHNPSICCSQLLLDGALKNDFGIESS